MLNYDKALGAVRMLARHPSHQSLCTPVRPSAEQLLEALSGLHCLRKMRLPVPSVSILEDGTFLAYWNTSCGYASVDFDTDGLRIWGVAQKDHVDSGAFRDGEAVPSAILKVVMDLKE